MRFARSSFTTLPVVQIYYLGLLALLLSVGRTLGGDIVRYLFCSVQNCATSSCDLRSRSHRNPVDSYEISTIRGAYAKFTIPVPVLPCFVPSLARVVADGGEDSPGLSGFLSPQTKLNPQQQQLLQQLQLQRQHCLQQQQAAAQQAVGQRPAVSEPAGLSDHELTALLSRQDVAASLADDLLAQFSQGGRGQGGEAGARGGKGALPGLEHVSAHMTAEQILDIAQQLGGSQRRTRLSQVVPDGWACRRQCRTGRPVAGSVGRGCRRQCLVGSWDAETSL